MITIVSEDTKYEVPRTKLLEYPYFKSIFKSEPSINQIYLPNKLIFSQSIELLLTTDDCYSNLDLFKAFNLLKAEAYLGAKTDKAEQAIINTLFNQGKLISLYKLKAHLNNFKLFGLIKRVAEIYQKYLTAYIDDKVIPEAKFNQIRIIHYRDLTDSDIEVLIELIPYMTSFDRAFTICDLYFLDFNLIKATPLLKDLFIYKYCRQHFQVGLKTKNFCLIFKNAYLRLIDFLKYFDFIYALSDFKDKINGYQSFEIFQDMTIIAGKNLTLKWKRNQKANLQKFFDLSNSSSHFVFSPLTSIDKLPLEIRETCDISSLLISHVNYYSVTIQHPIPFNQKYSIPRSEGPKKRIRN